MSNSGFPNILVSIDALIKVFNAPMGDISPPHGNQERVQIHMDEAALRKRKERANKHKRSSSPVTPNIFSRNYDPEKVISFILTLFTVSKLYM